MLTSRAFHNTGEPSIDSGPSVVNFPTKTPARAMPNKVAFNTVARTNLKENAVHRALLQSAQKSNMYPKTPGLKQSHIGSHRTFIKDNMETALRNTNKAHRLLDLTNKTPFLNHVAKSPSPAGSAVLKIPFTTPSTGVEAEEVEDGVPETIVRPSQMRTSLRVPRSASKFQTPNPSGRRKHWEVLSSEEISTELSAPPAEIEESECDDEVEYMPPPVTALPYDPGYDMPDYRELGEKLAKLGRVLDLNTLLGEKPTISPVLLSAADAVPESELSLSFDPLPLNEPVLFPYIPSASSFSTISIPAPPPLESKSTGPVTRATSKRTLGDTKGPHAVARPAVEVASTRKIITRSVSRGRVGATAVNVVARQAPPTKIVKTADRASASRVTAPQTRSGATSTRVSGTILASAAGRKQVPKKATAAPSIVAAPKDNDDEDELVEADLMVSQAGALEDDLSDFLVSVPAKRP